MGIATVVFDFGNVVGHFSHRKAAEQLAVYSALEADAILAYLFNGQLEDDFEAGRIPTADFIRRVTDGCRLSCTEAQFEAAFADMFHPNSEVCELLPRLKPGYRLQLLSNTNDLHARQFRRQFARTLAWFDDLVLSHEVGLRKPSQGVFEHCRRLAGCPPEACLFIDDLPANVAGARACGWHGLVYRPGDDLAANISALGVVLGDARTEPEA